MIWPRRPGQSAKTPSSQHSQSAISSPVRGGKFLYRPPPASVCCSSFMRSCWASSTFPLPHPGHPWIRQAAYSPPAGGSGRGVARTRRHACRSVRFRFTEIAQESRHRFRPCFGDDRGQALPDRLRVRGGDVRLRRRRQARPVFRNHDTFLPLGTAQSGPTGCTGTSAATGLRTPPRLPGWATQGFAMESSSVTSTTTAIQDVFLCNYGPNVLYLNNGDGTFTDISQSAGIDRPGWSSGGRFLDYDNDGDLDIYVANYGLEAPGRRSLLRCRVPR